MWLIAAIAVVGLGAGLPMTLSTDAVVSAAPKQRAGAAASIAETAYKLGVALGIAVLDSLHAALYRASLPPLDGLDPCSAAAVRESLATGTAVLGDNSPGILATAQHAFTSGMQVTSVITAVLLAVSAVIAWRVIPSTPEQGDESRDESEDESAQSDDASRAGA